MADVLTLPEVAKVLGCTRERAWQMVAKEEKIKGKKVGNLWLVKAHHLREYLERVTRAEVAKEASKT